MEIEIKEKHIYILSEFKKTEQCLETVNLNILLLNT